VIDSSRASFSPKGPCGCPIGEQIAGHCCCGADARSQWVTEPAKDQVEAKQCTSCTAAPKPCCKGHATPAACPPISPPRPQPSTDTPWTLRVSAATCQCTTTQWITTGEVCPPPPLLVWVPYLLPTGRVSPPDTTTRLVPLSPPEPPPRFLGV
jgi:hypothetical protein